MPWLFVLPSLAGLGIFVLWPAVHAIWLSLHESAAFSSEIIWYGLGHYRDLLASPEYRASFFVTLWFVLLTVPASVLLALAVALLLDREPFFRSLLRTVFLLPVGVSPAMAGMLWVFLYNPTAGWLNFTLASLGMGQPEWLTDPAYALTAVAVATVWKEIGFNVIFFLAALAAVPTDIREAATLDGAKRFSMFWNITLPLISPTMFFVTTVSVIHAFESFGQVHVLTRGGPADATNVLVYSIYKDAFENFNTGFASAQSVVLFGIILIVTAAQFVIARRRVHYQ